jgi:hypothetical protein
MYDLTGAVQESPHNISSAAIAKGWEVLERMRGHRGDIRDIVTPDPVTGKPTRAWHPLGLDPGDLGMALVYSAADELRPEDGWDRLAFAHVQRVIKYYTASPDLGIGLFSGTAGVAYALRALSRGGVRYQRALRDVDAVLLRKMDRRLATLPPLGGLTPGTYDIISGLAGAAMYLLHVGAQDGPSWDMVTRVVEAFCRLAVLPVPRGFWTPPSEITEFERKHHPELCGGYLNLGYAHGISGVLSLLGQAKRQQVPCPSVEEAATVLGAVLRNCLRSTDYGMDLPYYKLTPGHETARMLTRCAWCYGNIGAALAFAHAASVNPRFLVDCGQLLDSVEARPQQLRFDNNPSLCHGIGGQLSIQRYLAGMLGTQRCPLGRSHEETVERLLALWDDRALFGFVNEQPDGVPTDSPGFLTGAGGAAVALISLATGAGRISMAENMLCGGVLSC